ncbi:MAG: DUF1003 domain-containing protein [Acidobacteriota bacterium]
MNHTVDEIAEKHFGKNYDQLGEHEKRVAHHLIARAPISTNVAQEHYEPMTFGQRLADRVASFGGSWTFITIFAVVLILWILFNSYILLVYHDAFDPFPYILLNLVLSMLAAIQAPIILMSQNRQSYKDRLNAEHDYEVNLKAELEILALHEKIDALRENQWNELIALQEKQIDLLGRLTGAHD